jgi:hypothetical protein
MINYGSILLLARGRALLTVDASVERPWNKTTTVRYRNWYQSAQWSNRANNHNQNTGSTQQVTLQGSYLLSPYDVSFRRQRTHVPLYLHFLIILHTITT